ncbi:MAG: SMP-30/gluconolactonase/LRE family protein [Acidimicrobiales bacterium]
MPTGESTAGMDTTILAIRRPGPGSARGGDVKRVVAELALPAGALLGEGPSWDEASQRLLWVDILAGEVHSFDPVSGDDTSFPVGQHVSAAVPRSAGGLMLAVRDGFALLENGRLTIVADLSEPGIRMNDGKCAPDGAFWAGTMAYDKSPGRGTLYRMSPEADVTVQLAGVTISNGLAWSADGRIFYYVDTPTRRVDAFDVDPATNRLSRRRPLVEIGPGGGNPDGVTIDHDGALWVAMARGGQVRRYTPDGILDAVVEVPTPLVTSCCFGGAAGDELFITTARDGAAEPAGEHAGALFCCRPGSTGPPATPCAGP